MINRREILASGVAVSLLGPGFGATRVDASQRAAPAGVTLFVADDDNPYARAAASAAAARGAAVLGTPRDITSLYAALDWRWRDAQVAAAGMTVTSTLFAIERLALARGLRVVYRGMHRDSGGPTLGSELLGPAALLRRIEQAPASGFAGHLGRTLVDWMHSTDTRPQALRSLEPPSSTDERAAFVSWLFVPKRA